MAETETDDTLRRAEWLEMLLDVSRRIHAEANPDAVLAQIVHNLVSITGTDRAVLLLRSDDGQLRHAISRNRADQPLADAGLEVAMEVVDHVARTGETVLVEDAASSASWSSLPTVVGLGVRTIHCIPLRTQHGVMGVIYADSGRVVRRFTQDDIRLLEAFAGQAAAAVERVHLQKEGLDRDRIRRQLRMAAEIQRTFLPGSFPEVDGVQGAVASVPALDVGGDFYDVIRMPGGRVGLMIGDVSGKGIAGALFGARILSDVRYEALYQDDVGMTLTAVNRLVTANTTRGMFVTFLYAVIDPTTHRVHVGNAGHLPPVLRKADGELVEWTDPSGIPLGIDPDATYEAGVRHLEKEQTLFLTTDGLLDAANAKGERFGRERVHDALRQGPADPASLLAALRWAVATWTGRRRHTDDLTLLAASLR